MADEIEPVKASVYVTSHRKPMVGVEFPKAITTINMTPEHAVVFAMALITKAQNALSDDMGDIVVDKLLTPEGPENEDGTIRES